MRLPQCPLADVLEVPHIQQQPQGTALHDGSTQDNFVLENTEKEDLSFKDLNKIFGLDENVGERECASTVCNAAPTERLALWTERSNNIDQRLPTRPPPRNVPHRSSTMTIRATRPSRRQIWASQAAILQGAGNDHSARPTDGPARGANDIFPTISEITSSLDPFIRLPVQLPESDKSLLHFCKSTDRIRCSRSPDEVQTSIMVDVCCGVPLRHRDTAQVCTPSRRSLKIRFMFWSPLYLVKPYSIGQLYEIHALDIIIDAPRYTRRQTLCSLTRQLPSLEKHLPSCI